MHATRRVACKIGCVRLPIHALARCPRCGYERQGTRARAHANVRCTGCGLTRRVPKDRPTSGPDDVYARRPARGSSFTTTNPGPDTPAFEHGLTTAPARSCEAAIVPDEDRRDSDEDWEDEEDRQAVDSRRQILSWIDQTIQNARQEASPTTITLGRERSLTPAYAPPPPVPAVVRKRAAVRRPPAAVAPSSVPGSIPLDVSQGLPPQAECFAHLPQKRHAVSHLCQMCAEEGLYTSDGHPVLAISRIEVWDDSRRLGNPYVCEGHIREIVMAQEKLGGLNLGTPNSSREADPGALETLENVAYEVNRTRK